MTSVTPLKPSRPLPPLYRAVLVDGVIKPAKDRGSLEGRELLYSVVCMGQRWTFLIRIWRNEDGDAFVLRGFTQQHKFKRMEAELRQGLDSFQVFVRERP